MRKLSLLILLILILLSCKSQPLPEPVSEPEPTVKIIDPEFDVITIYIIQADIVVTEFEAAIKIDNPNDFAVELSSITYELYGNGRLWATGSGSNLRAPGARQSITREVFQIPANGSGEARFFFSMNFTNMNRALLDDVIAMRNVNYRFIGHAQIQPILSGVSSFIANFDCSGHSEVKQ